MFHVEQPGFVVYVPRGTFHLHPDLTPDTLANEPT